MLRESTCPHPPDQWRWSCARRRWRKAAGGRTRGRQCGAFPRTGGGGSPRHCSKGPELAKDFPDTLGENLGDADTQRDVQSGKTGLAKEARLAGEAGAEQEELPVDTGRVLQPAPLGQLPEGAPTVEVAEALLLGGGVSRPPACRSSFGIEIGFIDNVDMVKTNEKEEAVAASAAPAGVSSSHSADETVGASCPQAGFGGRSHADAAASGSEDAILKRGAKDIRTAFQYRHLIKEIYLKIAPKEWHQGGESMLDSWKGQERTLYLEMCRRIKVQPLSHEAVMKSIGVSSAGRVSARGSTS